MKKLTLILFLAIAKIGFAQQDTTLVYSSPMYTKDPVRSKWRPVIKRTGEFYQVTFYDRKDVIQEVIHFENKDLTVRKGEYASYQRGRLIRKGYYDKGHKNEEWITYNHTNQIKKTENFSYGNLDGRFVEYWEGGQVQQEGSYVKNKKIGLWKLFYRDGKAAGEENYDDAGKKVDGNYYDKTGVQVTYEHLFEKPKYEGGLNALYKYLASEIQYPKKSAKDGVQGIVKLSFVVKKDGGIEDIEILDSPNFELAKEAIRVLEMSPDWIPGKQFGEVVNVKYNIPIKFSLGR